MANAIRDENRIPTLNVPSSVAATTVLQPTATPIAGVNPLNVAIVDSTGIQVGFPTDNATGLTVKVAYTASQTGATVLTPTTGKKVVITDITISATGAGTVYLFDSTDSATTCIGPTLSLAANGGWEKTFAIKPFKSATANNVIKYTSGSGAAGSIWIQYYEV